MDSLASRGTVMFLGGWFDRLRHLLFACALVLSLLCGDARAAEMGDATPTKFKGLRCDAEERVCGYFANEFNLNIVSQISCDRGDHYLVVVASREDFRPASCLGGGKAMLTLLWDSGHGTVPAYAKNLAFERSRRKLLLEHFGRRPETIFIYPYAQREDGSGFLFPRESMLQPVSRETIPFCVRRDATDRSVLRNVENHNLVNDYRSEVRHVVHNGPKVLTFKPVEAASNPHFVVALVDVTRSSDIQEEMTRLRKQCGDVDRYHFVFQYTANSQVFPCAKTYADVTDVQNTIRSNIMNACSEDTFSVVPTNVDASVFGYQPLVDALQYTPPPHVAPAPEDPSQQSIQYAVIGPDLLTGGSYRNDRLPNLIQYLVSSQDASLRAQFKFERDFRGGMESQPIPTCQKWHHRTFRRTVAVIGGAFDTPDDEAEHVYNLLKHLDRNTASTAIVFHQYDSTEAMLTGKSLSHGVETAELGSDQIVVFVKFSFFEVAPVDHQIAKLFDMPKQLPAESEPNFDGPNAQADPDITKGEVRWLSLSSEQKNCYLRQAAHNMFSHSQDAVTNEVQREQRWKVLPELLYCDPEKDKKIESDTCGYEAHMARVPCRLLAKFFSDVLKTTGHRYETDISEPWAISFEARAPPPSEVFGKHLNMLRPGVDFTEAFWSFHRWIDHRRIIRYDGLLGDPIGGSLNGAKQNHLVNEMDRIWQEKGYDVTPLDDQYNEAWGNVNVRILVHSNDVENYNTEMARGAFQRNQAIYKRWMRLYVTVVRYEAEDVEPGPVTDHVEIIRTLHEAFEVVNIPAPDKYLAPAVIEFYDNSGATAQTRYVGRHGSTAIRIRDTPLRRFNTTNSLRNTNGSRKFKVY